MDYLRDISKEIADVYRALGLTANACAHEVYPGESQVGQQTSPSTPAPRVVLSHNAYPPPTNPR